jgi:hypothetical protein
VEGGDYFFGALRPIVVDVRRVARGGGNSCVAGGNFGGRILEGLRRWWGRSAEILANVDG